MGLRLLIAPNEDGLGASAWAVRLIKALVEAGRERIGRICVVVASPRLAAFHADKYPGLPVEVALLENISRPIRLIKRAGGVDIPATIETSVLGYEDSRGEYVEALARAGLLEQTDLVLDLGVPQLLHAVRRQERCPTPCLTFSDHAWSDTLGRMAASAGLLAPEVERCLGQMREDEALAERVFTLPEPIAPPGVERYWRRMLGLPVERLPGVLGGPQATRAWASGEPRAAVREMLGIEDEAPVLHLTGGGTSVWDDALWDLLDDYRARPPGYWVVVFSPVEAERRGIRMSWKRCCEAQVACGSDPAAPRVIYLGDVRGETHHVLFAGFDLVCTRAGGGGVNDALAFRVPLVLVEEPGHVQVEEIRRSAERLGLCRSVAWEEFRRRGRALLEDDRGDLIRLAEAAAAASGLAQHAEDRLARRLLELLRGTGRRSPRPMEFR